MRRSFHILFLFVATILGNLAVEITIPSLAMAAGPEPFELPQWTPFEMTVKPGTCQAQYDGMTAEAKIDDVNDSLIRRNDHSSLYSGGYPSRESFLIPSDPFLAGMLCEQYTRNKGWTIPSNCHDRYYGFTGNHELQRDYYCYCMRDAIVECATSIGSDVDVLPKLSGSSTTKARAPKQESRPMTAPEVAQAFVRAAELVREIARALRDDPSVSNPRPSGTPYVSPSRRADDLYARGMAAYAKPSHTDEETITALSSFGACIEEDPYHTPCIWQLGWVFWANGDYNLTDILWRRVKQIDPNHASVDEWLGKLQRKL